VPCNEGKGTTIPVRNASVKGYILAAGPLLRAYRVKFTAQQ